ncbi:MAG TPA: hypothetical protein VII12_12830, partial [Thermoanaerobaculia bacterium]
MVSTEAVVKSKFPETGFAGGGVAVGEGLSNEKPPPNDGEGGGVSNEKAPPAGCAGVAGFVGESKLDGGVIDGTDPVSVENGESNEKEPSADDCWFFSSSNVKPKSLA